MSSWGGRAVTRLRRAWATRLPLPCHRCHQLVHDTDSWDLEHDPPRSEGGTRVVGVSHASCNRSHGASLGNARRDTARRLGGVDTSW